MKHTSLLRGFVLAAPLALLVLAETVVAQVPPPGTPPAQVQQQIDALGLRGQLLARIRSSGMTPDQIRSRLASMGYDPRTLDPYLSEDSVAPPPPSGSTLAAIRALGMPDLAEVAVDTVPRPAPPTLTDEERRLNVRVFGVEVFSSATSQFDPIAVGAVPSDYVIGPGDELVLIITGDVEFVHTLPVTREGFVVIPQVGQVWVNGLTREQLRDQLYTRLGQVYSGISRGADATTRFDISLARLRTNQVYISGEVVRPGAYLVSPLASVLNALYQAGGPTGNGSFRDVHILRGGKLVQHVDLYDFLLRGDNLGGIRLEPGDVIFVPVHGTHVSIRGEVIREAIFELKPGETLRDLLAFAGGMTAPAHQLARLTRILPPAQRASGVDRVVIDIDIAEALSSPTASPPLATGDDLRVLAVTTTVRNMVSLSGSVWRPGSYEFRPGMRASELIEAGHGLTPEAFTDRAHITRINPADSSLIMVPFTLRQDASGKLVEDPVLEEFDVVTVYSRTGRAEELPIQVSGAVRQQVVERFQQGMTLRDAIIRAGGLRRTAHPVVEVARLADPAQRERGGLTQIIRIPVDSSYFVSDEAARYYLGDPSALRTAVGNGGEAGQFFLQPDDRIFVRDIPEFELPRLITVRGEVRYPGSYALQRKDERLRELLLGRAGGLTSTAHPAGFRLYRGGNLVNVDLVAVLVKADDPDNLILLPGDSMVIPEYNPVVVVQGAVNSPTAVLYKRGAGLAYYISNAGGYARNADRGRVHVRYANGSGRTASRTVFFRSLPVPEAGSVVTVPLTPAEERTDTRALISDIAQIVGVLATVVLVALR